MYQGPFDLLLSLVFKEEIDLLEVPLFEVISAYLDELEAKGATADWDEMSEFLLLMSLLVEIKSRLLLPGAEPGMEADLTPEQARDQLLCRLFEYSKFKAAAGRLRELGEQSMACLLPLFPSASRARRLPPLDAIAGSEDAMRLREAMMHVVESRREPDTSHIIQTKGGASAPDPDHQGDLSATRQILLQQRFRRGATPGAGAVAVRPARSAGPGRDTGLSGRELRRYQGPPAGHAEGRLRSHSDRRILI